MLDVKLIPLMVLVWLGLVFLTVHTFYLVYTLFHQAAIPFSEITLHPVAAGFFYEYIKLPRS